MALKGPHARSYFKDGVQFLAPSHYFELFRKLNVSAVVRLNDEQVSVREGESDGCERGRVEGVSAELVEMTIGLSLARKETGRGF